jgi:FlaA1/EpsC-like NDP-sugar epimerase
MDLGHPLTLRMIDDEGPFDIVANFAALKHVRSEKNVITTAYLVDNNVTKAESLLTTLLRKPPSHFFCVSTDKAANPVNVMGATKRLMEDLAFGVGDDMKSTTARFANVAFSNGSLLDGFLHRLRKSQPLSMPGDVRRYFVSWEEAGQLCLLACIAGKSREIFTPKLDPERDQFLFTEIAQQLLERVGSNFVQCNSEEEARGKASTMDPSVEYPCHVFLSDTTGEKSEEIFTSDDETTDDMRFDGIRVVKSNRQYPSLDTVRKAIRELNHLFESDTCTKEQVIDVLSEHLPTFRHLERNKYLDQRM